MTEAKAKFTRRRLVQAAGLLALGGAAAALGGLRNGRGSSVTLAQGPKGGVSFSKLGEADVHIALGEFFFQRLEVDARGRETGRAEKNALIELPAARELLVRFVNEGRVLHEIHLGRDPDPETLHAYRENLFGGGATGSGFLGLHLNPGQEAFLHLLLPEEARGDWEIGCFVPGHYQAGMHAPLRVV